MAVMKYQELGSWSWELLVPVHMFLLNVGAASSAGDGDLLAQGPDTEGGRVSTDWAQDPESDRHTEMVILGSRDKRTQGPTCFLRAFPCSHIQSPVHEQ